jgi:hypothetical protein
LLTADSAAAIGCDTIDKIRVSNNIWTPLHHTTVARVIMCCLCFVMLVDCDQIRIDYLAKTSKTEGGSMLADHR